jgi:hypothetical protein
MGLDGVRLRLVGDLYEAGRLFHISRALDLTGVAFCTYSEGSVVVCLYETLLGCVLIGSYAASEGRNMSSTLELQDAVFTSDELLGSFLHCE